MLAFLVFCHLMSTIGKLYRVREAALLLNVSVETVQKWIRKQKIQAVKLPSGHYRLPKSELVRILRPSHPGAMKGY